MSIRQGNKIISGTMDNGVAQFSVMPAAGSYPNKIVQYIGVTDGTYTNGYFYKSVSNGQTPATYTWTQTDVQPTSGGGGGSFVITDTIPSTGTDGVVYFVYTA